MSRFLFQPERTHERNLRSTIGRLALQCPCPEIGDGCCSVRVLRVILGQLLLGLLLDLPTYPSQFLGKLRPMVRDIFQHDLEDEAGHWVQVAGESIAAQPQGRERYRPTAREGVYYKRRLITFLSRRHRECRVKHLILHEYSRPW